MYFSLKALLSLQLFQLMPDSSIPELYLINIIFINFILIRPCSPRTTWNVFQMLSVEKVLLWKIFGDLLILQCKLVVVLDLTKGYYIMAINECIL